MAVSALAVSVFAAEIYYAFCHCCCYYYSSFIKISPVFLDEEERRKDGKHDEITFNARE